MAVGNHQPSADSKERCFCFSVSPIGLTHSVLKSPYPPDKGGYGGLGI